MVVKVNKKRKTDYETFYQINDKNLWMILLLIWSLVWSLIKKKQLEVNLLVK